VLFAGQTFYSKTNIMSARECALMCAADSLDDRSHNNLACKSFTYNKTAHECMFFNFAQRSSSFDKCCTSGPPCNLDSMRAEIQTHFHAELKRMMPSQKRQQQLSHELRETKQSETTFAKSEQTVARRMQKIEQKVGTHAKPAAPMFEHKVAKQEAKHTAPIIEQKIAAQPGHAMPKVEQKVAEHVEHVAPKVEQKVATLAKHAMPKVEPKGATHVKHRRVEKQTVPMATQKVAKQPVHALPNVEQKVVMPAEHMVPKVKQNVATQAKHAVPNVEQSLATQAAVQTKQSPILNDPISPAESAVKPFTSKPARRLKLLRDGCGFLLFCVPVVVIVLFLLVLLRWFHDTYFAGSLGKLAPPSTHVVQATFERAK
jgi:hypothetical protein